MNKVSFFLIYYLLDRILYNFHLKAFHVDMINQQINSKLDYIQGLSLILFVVLYLFVVNLLYKK